VTADDERWEMIWRHSFESVRRLFDKLGVAPPDDHDDLAAVIELPVEVEPEGDES
jgi:hypothetical protein